jgi:hypothetical protein
MLLHLLTLLPVLAAQAQDPGAAVAVRARAERAPDHYVLLASVPGLGMGWFGDDSLAAAGTRDLHFVMLEASDPARSSLEALCGGPGWALVGPVGNVAGSGQGLPTPGRIREQMTSDGWVPSWEKLDRYLAAHPDDGQAWLECAFQAARQGRDQFNAGNLPPETRRKLVDALLTSLQHLVDLADSEGTWQERRPQPFGPMLAALGVARFDEDAGIGDRMRHLQKRVLGLLEQDPESEALWDALPFTGPNADTEDLHAFYDASRHALKDLTPVPGRPWPPLFLATDFPFFFHKDDAGLAESAGAALASHLDPTVLRAQGENGVRTALSRWGALRLQGLLGQGRLDDVLQELGQLRTRAGSLWPRVASDLEPVFSNLDASLPDETARLRVLQPIKDLLAAYPPQDPPPVALPPLRLALLGGNQAERGAWASLHEDRAFDTWGPEELAWSPLPAQEETALRSRYAWKPGPRWVLLRGPSLLLSGSGVPQAPLLESALHSQEPSRLEILGRFIQENPDRRDARRERLQLLRPRLPNPRLEALFVADLEACALPIGPLPFHPDGAVWTTAAHRLTARLQERLAHWPFDRLAWAAYADWSALDPKAPSPGAFLGTLETWPWQLGRSLPGPLPAPVALDVGQSLEAQGSWKDVDVWFSALWERGLRDWTRKWASLGPAVDGAGRPWYDGNDKPVRTLLAEWGKAMKATGNHAQRTKVALELDSFGRGLSRLLDKN